ncbi:MAG: transcriptional regulator PpsR, partial [Myxococcota bacterium]
MHGLLSEETLGALDVKVVAEVISASTDIALVLDQKGIIKDVSIHPSHRDDPRFSGWIGLTWRDTVALDSQPKVEALLREVRSDDSVRSREINHRHTGLEDFPVRYSAIPLGNDGNILAIGRELGTVANLQQQLMNAQQAMEREYARLRSAETRYRLLFQISSEAVLIVDAESMRVTEANPAALELITRAGDRIDGKPLAQLFEPSSADAVAELLGAARSSRSGSAPELPARLRRDSEGVSVSATVFRQGANAHFLVRVARQPADGSEQRTVEDSRLLEVLAALPDAFVVIDEDRRVLTANGSFFNLVQVATESQVTEQPLDRWLGRPGVDLNIIMANLREHGSVRNFSTVMQGELGVTEQVEVSAVSAMNDSSPC